MKVAQINETDPDTQPVHPPQIPSIANLQLSPSGSSDRKRETPGILSRMFSPFAGTTYYRVGARIATRLVLSCIVMHLFALYLLFLPPLLSLDTKTDATAAPFDYGVDDPSFLPEQPGKLPLDHQISPIFLYTACIRVVQHVTVRLLLFCCIACHCCYSC